MNYSKYNDRKSYDILGDRQYFFSNGKIFIGKNFYSLGGMFAHDNAFLSSSLSKENDNILFHLVQVTIMGNAILTLYKNPDKWNTPPIKQKKGVFQCNFQP